MKFAAQVVEEEPLFWTIKELDSASELQTNSRMLLNRYVTK